MTETEKTKGAGAATITPADPHANPGTAESQVEFLTRRIQSITEHLKTHRKDHTTRRGLLMLVGQRSRLLKYLKRKDEERYQSLIKRLGLRK